MSEQKATERISLYIDGELTAQEREEVARRIEADEEWAEIHERLCRTSRAIGDFFKESNATLPEDTYIVVDAGTPCPYFAAYYKFKRIQYGPPGK